MSDTATTERIRAGWLPRPGLRCVSMDSADVDGYAVWMKIPQDRRSLIRVYLDGVEVPYVEWRSADEVAGTIVYTKMEQAYPPIYKRKRGRVRIHIPSPAEAP